MKRKLLSVPLAPSAKAGAISSEAPSQNAFATASKAIESASIPNKTTVPADTECTPVSKLTPSGLSSADATPAPAKRRKLLVLGSSRDIKVQQTSTQKHSSPPAGAKVLADEHCKNAAWSKPEVQKTNKLNHKSGAAYSPGRAVAAAVKAKANGVPNSVERAQVQQAEHTPAFRVALEALPCEAATFGPQHGIPAVSSTSDRLAQSSISTSTQPSFDNCKTKGGVKVLTAASPQTAIDSVNKQETAPSGTHAALSASPKKHSIAAIAKPPSILAGTLTPADVKGKPGLERAETLLMVQRLPAVLTGSLPTAQCLGLQLSMPSTIDVLRQIPKPAFQGLHNPAVQRLCAPGMLQGLQAELWPQRLLATDADMDMHIIAADIDAASWVVCSSQHVITSRLVQELCKSIGSSKSLKLVVPSVIGQYKPVYSSGRPDVPSSAEAADIAPSRNCLPGPTSGVAVTATIDRKSGFVTKSAAGQGSGGQSDAHDVRCLVATQQSEFADIWKSPEKQEDECNRALDAFPISLSFLQALGVLG
ncbi:hypothetical protein WJX77_011445 [Trebouxia sp. C0004]